MKKQICSCGQHHEGESCPGRKIEGKDMAPAVVSVEEEFESKILEAKRLK